MRFEGVFLLTISGECGPRMNKEKGPVDHEFDVRCKVYENGRVAADAETLSLLKQLSEREIEAGTGVHRSRVRLLRHGRTVTRRRYRKIEEFLRVHANPSTADEPEFCRQLA